MNTGLKRSYELGQFDCGSCTASGTSSCGALAALISAAGMLSFKSYVFEPGAALMQRGAPALGVHFVVSGAVKLVCEDFVGKERIVRIVQDGGIIGLEALTESRTRHVALALDEVRTCWIDAVRLRDSLQRVPELQLTLLRQMQAALHEAESWISDLASGTVPARVRLARLLLRLRLGGENRVRRLNLSDVGAILGQTPETVCRALKTFTRDKVLVPQGGGIGQRFYLADIEALHLIARDGAPEVARVEPVKPPCANGGKRCPKCATCDRQPTANCMAQAAAASDVPAEAWS